MEYNNKYNNLAYVLGIKLLKNNSQNRAFLRLKSENFDSFVDDLSILLEYADDCLNEKFVSYKTRLYRKKSGQSNALFRTRGGRNTSKDRHGRAAPSGAKNRKLNRISREIVIKQRFPSAKWNKMTKYQKASIQAMVDSEKGRIKRISKSLGKSRIKFSDMARLSRPDNRYRVDLTGGYGKLGEYIHILAGAEYLIEADSSKLNRLLQLGLKNKNEIQLYKRALDNAFVNVKFQQYRDKIVNVLNRLLEIIMNDTQVYTKVELNLRRKKIDELNIQQYNLYFVENVNYMLRNIDKDEDVLEEFEDIINEYAVINEYFSDSIIGLKTSRKVFNKITPLFLEETDIPKVEAMLTETKKTDTLRRVIKEVVTGSAIGQTPAGKSVNYGHQVKKVKERVPTPASGVRKSAVQTIRRVRTAVTSSQRADAVRKAAQRAKVTKGEHYARLQKLATNAR